MNKPEGVFQVWNIDGSWQAASDEFVAAMDRLFARLAEIDPNWSCGYISFLDDGVTLAQAVVNGPKEGSVSFADQALELVPAALLAAQQPHRVRRVPLYNPAHKPVLDPERTVIHFENCEKGYISAIEAPAPGELDGRGEVPETVYVVTCFESADDEGRDYRYTEAQIIKDLATEDPQSGEVVEIRYLPFLGGPSDMAALKAAYTAPAAV